MKLANTGKPTGFTVPEGLYLFTITDAEYGESKEKKTPFVQFTYEVADSTTKGVVGKELKYQTLYLTEKTGWRFLELCSAALNDDSYMLPDYELDIESNDFDDLLSDLVRGQFVTHYIVKEETYEGTTRSKNESKFFPARGGRLFHPAAQYESLSQLWYIEHPEDDFAYAGHIDPLGDLDGTPF